MRDKKIMGRAVAAAPTHQVSYTEQKLESLRRFYANNKPPADFALMRASNLIKRFRESPLKELAETNLLLKAKAFLSGAK